MPQVHGKSMRIGLNLPIGLIAPLAIRVPLARNGLAWARNGLRVPAPLQRS